MHTSVGHNEYSYYERYAILYLRLLTSILFVFTLMWNTLRAFTNREYNYYGHYFLWTSFSMFIPFYVIFVWWTLHLVPRFKVLPRGQDLPILYYTRAYKFCVVSFCSRTDRRVGARRRKEYPEHGKCETGGETVGCRCITEKVDEGT